MIPSPSSSLHSFHFSRLAPSSSSNFSLTKHISHYNSMAPCVDASQLSRNPNKSKSDDNSFNYRNFHRPNYSNHVSCIPFSNNPVKSTPPRPITENLDQATTFEEEEEDPWLKMQEEAKMDIEQEPILSTYYYTSILSQKSLKSALANHLAGKLSNSTLPTASLFDTFIQVFDESEDLIHSVKLDLRAVKERDPACLNYVQCFLNFKGFISCQSHRIAHKLWTQGRKALAIVIQNRVSEVFGVDIHPGAKIGNGIMLDHATGVVVGETAVIGNNVSILHNVTLGGTGKRCGDRHPKIGDGVLIGAGTCILGNIRIGEGAKIGAGSVVLKDVPARTTAVGNPARLVGGKRNPIKLDDVPSLTMDHTSYIDEWSNYVI